MMVHNFLGDVVLDQVDHLLTVILVIRDRPFYTFRWMHYANTTRFPFQILIADGGKDLAVESQLSNPSNYPQLRYRYLRYPYDASTKEYLHKIANALQHVNTPYVVLADDDDFWNEEGLRASIHFLKKNPTYATCRGRNITFSIDSKNKNGTRFDARSFFYDISNESAADRVMAILPYLGGTFYNVHYTANYQRIFQIIAEINFRFLPMMETMVALMDVISGKMKQLDVAYIVRENDHGQSTSIKQNNFSGILSEFFAENLSALLKTVTQEVSKKENIDADIFIEKLREAYINQLAPRLANHLYAYYPLTFSQVIQNIKTWVVCFFEKNYPRIGKYLRLFSKRSHRKKASKALQIYLEKSSDEKILLQRITLFLKDTQ